MKFRFTLWPRKKEAKISTGRYTNCCRRKDEYNTGCGYNEFHGAEFPRDGLQKHPFHHSVDAV